MNPQEQPVKIKRKVLRSPNYPSLSLGDAIDKARQIEAVEKRTAASGDTILAHLGYKPGVGPGLRALSALRQYGLLEEHDGLDRISNAAFNILKLSETSPERVAALKEAAKRPALFRQILDFYKDGLPSDINLRDHLIRVHSFNPDSVATFIKTLRETIELAKLYPSDNDAREDDVVQENDGVQNAPPKQGMVSGALKDPEGAMRKLASAREEEFISVPLSSGVRARVLTSGGPIGIKDVDKLIKVLKLHRELLEEDDDPATKEIGENEQE
jgi:hypothetical protein